jgi:segregation and condensation protein B
VSQDWEGEPPGEPQVRLGRSLALPDFEMPDDSDQTDAEELQKRRAALQSAGAWQHDVEIEEFSEEVPLVEAPPAPVPVQKPEPVAVAPPKASIILEAMLFAGGAPLTAAKACSAIRGFTEVEFHSTIAALGKKYRAQKRPYAVQPREDGFVIAVLPTYRQVREKLYGGPKEAKLTPAALDVLSAVAYRQPASKTEVDALRGGDCGSQLRQLQRLALIAPAREPAADGEPRYNTTPRFLELFQLESLDDLPRFATPTS